MKKIALAILFILATISAANAAVLTFDNISDNGWGTAVPNGYGGFNWSNMYVLDTSQSLNTYGQGYLSGPVSGTNVAFNGYGSMAITSSSGDFNFDGAYFTSAWYNNNLLTVQGFRNGILVDTATMTLDTTTPQWLNANFTDIDTLTFSTNDWQFAMDNFTFDEAAPVPEPGTVMLLGAGFLGLAIYGKRRRNA